VGEWQFEEAGNELMIKLPPTKIGLISLPGESYAAGIF
jgi:hypothetical protein